MFELKPCPFCGGFVKVVALIGTPGTDHVDAVCEQCRMGFSYDTHFYFSESARVYLNEPFETLYNNGGNQVVRCKDCKHLFFKDLSAFCPYSVGPCKPDDFCSYGERKEG